MSEKSTCNEEKHKESCKYSIDISKQFITLSSAGIAFIVGLAVVPNTSILSYYYWAGGSCFFSICFGLIYIMSAIAHINKNNNYNVYTTQLRFFASMQIILFLVGVIVLSLIVFIKINGNSNQKNQQSSYNLFLKSGDKEVKQLVDENTKLDIFVSENGEIKLTVEPVKQ